jgi:hypothetical protein
VHPKSVGSIKLGEVVRTRELGVTRWVSFDADDKRIGTEWGSRTRDGAAQRVVTNHQERVLHEREFKETDG